VTTAPWLESVGTLTPLGIRFWDAVTDAQVTDGLDVLARPQTGSARPVRAFRTTSGVYAFAGLPGLRQVEHRAPDVHAGFPPPTTHFLVEVTDRRRRFLPTLFGVMVPHKGVYPTGAVYSPPDGGPPAGGFPGFYLFSSCVRPVMPGIAAVRARLVDRDRPLGPGAYEPARHALVEVEVGGHRWFGVSDARGVVVVLLPYPRFAGSIGVSLPDPGMRTQSWDLTVRVRYQPDLVSTPPWSQVPRFETVAGQPDGGIWATRSLRVSSWQQLLRLGEELELRTGGHATSELLIDAEGSPP
jgi:hypothetical protein